MRWKRQIIKGHVSPMAMLKTMVTRHLSASLFIYYATVLGLALALPYYFTGFVYANPEGGSVVAGSASISQEGSTTTINQSSGNAVINWNSFNIEQAEHTQFQQPSGSSITLNRVDPSHGGSAIYGKLTANGQVWIMNPAGIFFGSTARVDVGGLLATTADISNEDFMSGNFHFVQSQNWHGAVTNEGIITVADRGLVALVAPGVENSGVINANLGRVSLSATNEFTVDLYGDKLIQFGVNSEVSQPAVNHEGQTLKNGVSHSGKIIADGGTVVISANTAKNIVDHAINMSGYVKASSARVSNGQIVLEGGSGAVRVSGTLLASGKHHGRKGGTVQITGKQIELASTAKINVSGKGGGGTVLIGGNPHGAGPLPNASQVYVAEGALIDASAGKYGNGGSITVWADNSTQFYGQALAKGGSISGNGGWIETSGGYLDISGAYINTSAVNGRSGTWLLDPADLTISAGATANPAPFTPNYTADNNSNTSNVNVTDLTNSLVNNDVVIETTTGGSGTGVGNITVQTPILWSSIHSLELKSVNNIIINAASAITTGAAGSSLILNLTSASGTATQSSAIGGSGSLQVTGLGTVTLSQSNTYSGGTVLNGGTLSLTTITGGASNIGTGSLSIDNGATLRYTGNNANTNRAITIGSNGGTIQTSNAAVRTLTLSGGITNNGALTFDTTGGGPTNITVSTVGISGAGSVTKMGSGNMTFSTANSYTGSTTITDGTLMLTNLNGLGSGGSQSSSILVNSGATLNLNFASATLGNTNPFTLNGDGVGSNGALTSSTNTMTVSNDITLGSNVTVGGANSLALSGVISDGGSGYSLTMAGANTLTLSNANTYSGGTTANSGTIAVTNTNGLGTTGALAFNNASILSINLGGNTLANSSNLTLSGTSTLTNAATAGTTNTLNNNISLTGTTATINSTTNNGILSLTGNINNGSTSLSFGGTGDTTVSGIIGGGSGSLSKAGNGDLTLSGANTYSGSTTVSAGVLSFNTLANPDGSSSALGAPTSAANGTISLTGTLLYTGSGSSSSRIIDLTGTGILTASGTGSLDLSGGITGTNQNLTLNGTGTASESGAIATGSGTLTESGSGTWTLSGTNTYTGLSTISSGTLVIANAAGLGDIAGSTTVANGGTLQIANVTLNNEAFTLNNGSTLLGTGTASVPGAITFGGSAANRTISALSSGDSLTIGSALNGTVALTLGGAGNIVLSSAVGDLTALNSLTANASLSLSNGTITTSGTQTYNNALTLGANTTLSSTDSTISLAGAAATVDNATTTARDFTISSGTGAIILGGNLGAGSNGALGAINLNSSGNKTLSGTISAASLGIQTGGTTTINTSTISSSGAQNYNGAVTLATIAKTFTSTGSSISFGSTVNGGFGLTLDANSGVTFGGTVGATTALGSLAITGTATLNAASIRTSGTQTYNNAFILGAGATLTTTANSLITFASTVDRDATVHNLTLSTGSGGASFNANVGAGVNGALGALAVTSTGTTTFNGTVNAASLTVSGNGGSTILNNGNVTTSGIQTYNNALSLGANTTLTTTDSLVTIGDTLNNATATVRNLTVNAGAGGMTFGDIIGGGANGPLGVLALNTTGTTTFSGAVSAASLATDAGGSTAINGGSITTTGASGQVYDDAVTLNAPTTLNADSGAITFASTLNSLTGTARALTLNSTGTVTFSENVGVTNALASLTVGAGGTTLMGAGIVTTTGNQVYNSPMTLTADSTFNTTNSIVTFASTLDRDASARSLTVNAGNDIITLGGNVGAGVNGPLGAIALNTTGATILTGNINAASLTTNTGGTTTINSSTITTSGAQSYGEAVTLATADKTLTSTGSSIGFASTINGAFNLALSANTGVTFDGTVGNTTALSSLAVTGTTTLNAASIRTSGTQTYNDAFTLGSNATLSTTANSLITFSSTVDRDATVRNLTVSTGSGGISFNDNVGAGVNGALGAIALTTTGTITIAGTLNAASLSVTGVGGSTVLNGGTVTTSGTQTYRNAVILGAATTLNTTDSQVSFLTGAATVDNNSTTPRALTINSGSGTINFSGDVGSGANGAIGILALNSTGTITLGGSIAAAALSTLAGGNTAINGGSVTTTGAAGQVYNNIVTLNANTTLAAGNGPITFASSVNSATATARALTLSTGGVTTFGGAVGATNALASITTDSPGTVAINGGSVRTTGSQTYNDIVTMSQDTTFTVTAANASISLANTSNNFSFTPIFDATGAGSINVLTLSNASPTAAFPTFSSTPATLNIYYPNASLTLPSMNLAGSLTASSGGTLELLGAMIANAGSITVTNLNGGNIILNGPVQTTASGSGISLSGNVLIHNSLSLTTNNGNINISSLSGPYALTVNSGASGNTTFNGLVNVNSYTQNNVGTLTFNGAGLIANAFLVTGNTVNGEVNVGSLGLNTNFANLFGTVGGSGGRTGADHIDLLNQILPRTHFFDGIDLYGNYVVPANLRYYAVNRSQYFSYAYYVLGFTITELESSDNLGCVSASCVSVGGGIEIRSKTQ